MRAVLRSVAVAGLLTVVVVVAGVLATSGGDDPGGDGDADRGAVAPEGPTGTPLASLDTTRLTLARADFCGAVPEEALTEALGGEPGSATSYGNGERARLATRVRDVAHEFGCTWKRPGGATARAWVFAPPVTRAQARDLAASARRGDACAEPPAAAAFGRPTVALVCGVRRPEASYRGLFGDAWLTCTLTAPDAADQAELVDRTGRWCVATAGAAAAE